MNKTLPHSSNPSSKDEAALAKKLDEKFQHIIDHFKKEESKADLEPVMHAWDFARDAHKDQKRKSGDPFISHPLETASILADFRLDTAVVAAALLHDILEDTSVTEDDLRREFGEEILSLVQGVTKLSRLEEDLPSGTSDKQADNMANMIMAMARDIRVVLIKMADRLHNMRTLQYLEPERQVRIAKETLEYFAPLAHRLGMGAMRWELEDLAFKRLYPEEYEELVQMVAVKREDRERYLREVIIAIELLLRRHKLEARVMGRAKHLYSIWRKMRNDNLSFDQIMDLHAVRILVDSIQDCYSALGFIHTVYKPLFERFKDYIGCPKTNLYQSLHTTVIGPKGQPVEIQIRTWEMHQVAEYGIAAHWLYKEGRLAKTSLDEKVSWLREAMDFRRDSKDNKEFVNALLVDIYRDEVFVFTPKGDIKALPAESTPVDFAYRIHTEIGHRCRGAKVNKKMVSLNTPLKNGDIVEIIVAKGDAAKLGPSRDWLNFVRTSNAREKIRAYMRKDTVEDAVKAGRRLLENEQKRLGFGQVNVISQSNIKRELKLFSCKNLDELYFMVGRGDLSPKEVIEKLRNQLVDKLKNTKQKTSAQIVERRATPQGVSGNLGIMVDGSADVFIRLARCCQPIPGDSIIGFTTKGRGISIHSVIHKIISIPDVVDASRTKG
ncbi:MAG: bifunctional (p)ppGpp synthetase/guanosine-3',5'-bis(diphosphate) 3'-pyrophosphohydrolase [bacterium]|nr:bifunctional (p)ppGpp synthetase/guanosine-3',5'-bis(diphosphate) 3'-pyrophosphohydrolase [bacterium]